MGKIYSTIVGVILQPARPCSIRSRLCKRISSAAYYSIPLHLLSVILKAAGLAENIGSDSDVIPPPPPYLFVCAIVCEEFSAISCG